MEFKEVIGRRRSIRFFEPDKPVEREKIQTMLEAALLSSCAVNAHWLKAVVVNRDDIPEDKLEQLKTPVLNVQLDLAPVHIYFFFDLSVVNEIEGSRTRLSADIETDDGEPRYILGHRCSGCRSGSLPGIARRGR